MFGYITPYKERLSEEDKKVYESYYCGLCKALGKKFGPLSQLILAYDPVFLAILTNGLYEQDEAYRDGICVYKGRKVSRVYAPDLSYAADMNLMLSYHNYIDQAHDSKSRAAKRAVRLLRRPYMKTAEKYPRQKKALEEYMKALSAYEKEPDGNPDHAGNLTGTMLSEVFLEREDEWQETLRRLFFYMGKFIYLADAYADVFDDAVTGSYNPYSAYKDRGDFDSFARTHLEQVISECARAFEMLPVFRHREILRNILYSGVWTSFSTVRMERLKKTENGGDA
ncbi:MAG: hypothetical protein IJL78_03900 [Lachnospiraceae bacterium]|nr:hypothetical protein [Lachnospiraceae bacterium]